ncbi:ArnT family glycosyltransferase [Flavimarina sp. Hel_I_48]|uniref:ArnT family glycosyltransferase n=1 Tax=Flavimarina sp. Hel_I_48 TaxID=1392488 RepID=UPI0004DFAD32|nr:glycosyltransferase family 39 protein [Flavimarina sp. Hel_I_48]
MTIRSKYHLLLLFFACFCLFFTHLDVLYENIMEARNFNTAREMVNYDNWVLTTMNGEARYEKPPLPTWLAAISGAIFGMENTWALRLPSALVTTFLIFFFYRFVEYSTRQKEQAFNAALILATSFYILFAGRNGTWDIFAHAFMLAGIYFLFQFFEKTENTYKNAVFSGIFIGLSFMSKGPVSHFALLLPFLIAYGIVYKFKAFRPKVVPFILMIILIAVLSSWWAIAVYVLDPASATAIADKEATAWANHNTRPLYYYWSFFTQSGIWTIPAFIGLLYPYLKTRVENLKAYKFSLIWTLAAVILLSLVPEKKSRYLLPVLIPLAMNTSFYVQYLFRYFSALKDKKETVPVYFNFGLISVIALSAPVASYIFLRENLNGLWIWFIPFSIFSVVVGIFMFRSLVKKVLPNVFYLTVLFLCGIVALGFPLARASYTNTDYARLAPKVRELDKQEIPQYLFTNGSPELIWDLGQRVPLIQSAGKTLLPSEKKFAVWMTPDEETDFKSVFKNYNLQFQTQIDGNITSKADRNYKERRIAKLYFVQKTD